LLSGIRLAEIQAVQEASQSDATVGAAAKSNNAVLDAEVATLRSELEAMTLDHNEALAELRSVKKKGRQSFSVMDAMHIENSQLKGELADLEVCLFLQ
jgi:hypothetical protein